MYVALLGLSKLALVAQLLSHPRLMSRRAQFQIPTKTGNFIRRYSFENLIIVEI